MMPYCSNCGQHVDPKGRFCVNCGKPMDHEEPEPSKVKPPQYYCERRSTNWSKAGAIILLLCGITALIGVFLPWISASVPILEFDFSASFSGWEAVSIAGIEDVPEVLLVIIGAGLMILSSLPAVMLAMVSDYPQKAVRNMIFVATISTLLVLGGALWFIILAISDDFIGYTSFGVYLSVGAAVIGFIFGIIAYIRARHQVEYF